MENWSLRASEMYERRFKWFQKKHEPELRAMLVHLNDVVNAVNRGTRPALLKAGFIHNEKAGVIALDQKGDKSFFKGKPTQTRLYVYADEDDRTWHLITIGDKGSQKEDVEFCVKYVETIIAQKS